MTPDEHAARDRLAAFLAHPGLRREVEPGDPADVIAVITGRLDMPRLYKSDLRLLLAALDRHDAIEESALETARHIAEFAERHGPVPDRVEVTYSAAPAHRSDVAPNPYSGTPQGIVRRVITDKRAGASDQAIARNTVAEALHLITGHDGDATDCDTCHDATDRAVHDVRTPRPFDLAGCSIVVPQGNGGEPCMCYRDGAYVGLGGACTCALRGVQDCPCLTRERGGQCEDCFCCTAAGCRNGPGGPVGQHCPSNDLGESVCPCTGD